MEKETDKDESICDSFEIKAGNKVKKTSHTIRNSTIIGLNHFD